MQCITECPLLEFNSNTLDEVRKLYGFNNRDDMNRAIDVLETWVKQQNHFLKKDFDRCILEGFIVKAKGSLQKSKKRLDTYCTVRTLLPKYFGDYDFNNDYKELQGLIYYCILPKLTEDNHRIFVYKNVGQKFPDNVVLVFFRSIILLSEYLLKYDYCAGYTFVVDLRKADLLALASKLNVVELQETISILFKGYGFRLKSVHAVVESKLIDIILMIFKKVLSKKIYEKIHIHKSIEEVHEFVSKDILPEEYGGKETKSVEEFQDEFTIVARSERETEFRREMNKAGTDESLRQNHKFLEDYMGTPGSFRTFVVD